MEGKFGGKSPREYFLESSAAAIELCYKFFCTDLTEELSAEEKFHFVIRALDNYFYCESNDKKRSRICPEIESDLVGEQVAKKAQKSSQLPCYNITGKLKNLYF